MKKTSAYARKRKACATPDNLAGLRLLDHVRPYEPDEMVMSMSKPAPLWSACAMESGMRMTLTDAAWC